MPKRDVLRATSFGARVAEEEAGELARYFVETEQWRTIFAGDVDIVYGSKGSGKSALYSLLVNRGDELFDRGIILKPAEKPRGTPAFKDLVSDPPTTELEFVSLWKLYTLSLIGEVLNDYSASTVEGRQVLTALRETGLLRGTRSLTSLLNDVLRYVRNAAQSASLEGTVSMNPTTGAPIVTGKITLREPSPTDASRGFVSLDRLFELADSALIQLPAAVWVLLDRLDVAFAETQPLEENALRALFNVYLGILDHKSIRLKIFLRSDIWKRITERGFREASHITRYTTIRWDAPSLLYLVTRRALQNDAIISFYGIDPAMVLQSTEEQRGFFYRMFPAQVDVGSRQPRTFEWMLSRTEDGTGQNAPRELIHLLNATRSEQLRLLDLGSEAEPEGEQLFSRSAIKQALPEVSKARLEQTLLAEYPGLRESLIRLTRQKTRQTPGSLAEIWGIPQNGALALAQQLVEVGFFELQGTREAPEFWVPFLYRDALEMIQGTAD